MQRIPKTPPSLNGKPKSSLPLSKHRAEDRVGQIVVEFYFPIPGRLLNLVLEVLAGHEVGDIIIISLLLALLHVLVALGQLAERSKRVGAELVQDAGHELRKLLVLAVAVDGKGVGRDSGVDYKPDLSACIHPVSVSQQAAAVRTLGSGEVDDIAVALKHVDLLDGLDRLDIELLERLLQLLVVAGGARGRALHLSPRGTLATIRHTSSSEFRSAARVLKQSRRIHV